jgi:hypothetical protein
VTNFPREIDPDEGRDSREPFFAIAIPCESCGQPCEETKIAKWDPALHVGACCEFCIDFEIPDLPNCIRLWEAIENCKSVGAVRAVFAAHASGCPICRDAVKLPEAV